MPSKLKTRSFPSAASRRAVMASASLLFLILPAWSHSHNAEFQQMLYSIDANSDWAVTRDELIESRRSIFDRLDRKADGVINKKDRPPPIARKRFDEVVARLNEGFDANDDGQLTYDEFVGGPTPGFDDADIDGDDVLSAEEITNLNSGVAD